MEEFSDVDMYVEIPDSYDIASIRSQVSDIAWEVGFENDRIIQAEALYNIQQYNGVVNRGYYAMFYAALAILLTKELGTSKH